MFPFFKITLKEIKENHLTTTITHTYGLENDIITELSDCKDLMINQDALNEKMLIMKTGYYTHFR